jgi:acetylornithine/succinyldiaminopimelate/putrescine aminotransferase
VCIHPVWWVQGAFESMRFIPPLNVTKEEIDTGLERFEKACADVFTKSA